MNNFEVAETAYTPGIYFDSDLHVLSIKGKSYPENTAEFYAPMFAWLEKYLGGIDAESITVNFEIVYFNSSSSKILMDFFDLLETATEKGGRVTINWFYDIEDEDMLEFGEEFREDYPALNFNLIEKAL